MSDILRCPECRTTKIRTRVRTGEHVCERCGNIWKDVPHKAS